MLRANADVTIYNKYLDPATKSDKYRRVVIYGVHWFGAEASNRVNTGRNAEDKAYISIPFSSSPGEQYVSPREYRDLEDKTGYFTIAPEDRIVKGAIDFEITGRVSELDKAYDAYTITAVECRDYGSSHLNHWAVTAK